MKQPILVTRGAGTIGAHTCVELLAAGHEVVVLDNLSNSRHSVLGRIGHIHKCGVSFGQWSIRVNDQFRVCFIWRDGAAWDVEIVDYH